MKYPLILIVLSMVFSCSPSYKNAEKKQGQSDSLSSNENSFKINDLGYLTLKGDSIEIPEFEISLSLSEKAEEKLKSDHESIIIGAVFSGNAIKNIPKEYSDQIDHMDNSILLVNHPIELTDQRVAQFRGVKFHKELIKFLADKDIQILVNVYSGRRTTNLNLLSCDILQDKMSNVIGKTFKLTGKLIKE